MQRFPEAQAAYEHALSLDPTNSDALQGKAEAHEATRREQARQVAEGLGDIVPYTIIEGLGLMAQLIGRALAALFMHQ